MLKYFYCFFLSLVLVFLSQSVFIAFIPPERLNLLVVFLVFITFVSGLNWGFAFALFIGLLANFYSYLPFPSYIIIYLIIIFMVDYLHRQIFINFTFATNLILIILSTVAFSLLLTIINLIFYFLGISRIYIGLDWVWLANFIWQIINNLILMSLIFVLAKAIFKKLNLTILVKR
ncbi:MAG: hypothetical protein NTX82_06820 [Candidatus Parcubacteria bacterium]|nr:hypothetical protein [Candidatus Parcubacteria bacterium]